LTSLAITVRGAAPAALVWRRYTEPDLWPTWSPQIASVSCADRVIRTGSTGTVHAVLGVQVRFEVTRFDDLQRTWAWDAMLPLGIRLHLEHSVMELDASGPDRSSTGLRVSGPLPIVLGYLPVARLALGRLLRP
jgi:hypothetical protein